MCRPYFLLLLLFCSSAQAGEEKKEAEEVAPEEAVVSEPDREEQMSKLIEKNLRSGESIWLGNVDDAFLALYKKDSSKKTQGGILILHDLGANANWPQLINPLRLGLAKKGWHTLSVQLPMVDPEVEKEAYLTHFDEAVVRVGAGIEQLKQKDVNNIVIIGHGMGAAVGTFYLSQTPKAPVAALVTISLVGQDVLKPKRQREPAEELSSPDPDAEKTEEKKTEEGGEKLTAEPETASTTSVDEVPLPDRDLFSEMMKIKVPFLDTYAQQDHQDVLREAERRIEIMQQSENLNYSQWEVEGAGHYFRGHDARLIKRLRGWLKNHAEGEGIVAP